MRSTATTSRCRNTGTDPFTLQKQSDQAKQKTAQATQQAQQVDKGSGAKGAVAGAAGGALIGAIAGDAGKGAAIGPVSASSPGGARESRRRPRPPSRPRLRGSKRRLRFKSSKTNFKKAFSVCLEAKNYMVKY